MANVLEKIVADKAIELEQLKQALPLEMFKASLSPSNKSFYQALAADNAQFIFECKKASPSKGLIREHFDLDEIITAYTPYAAAISVLTDQKYFQGSYEYLRYVTDRVEQPVLNKDFFIDPYQVHLARYYNADAILLMLSVLNDETYRELATLAAEYQLDVLTEVSNEEEVKRAIALGAKIIGINNRNLRDLSTDLATTEKLAPMLPEGSLVISESGIYTNQHVRRLAPLSDGFLVGSALMAQQDLNQAVKDLIYGEVKVCGITRAEDAKAVQQSGAHYAGLIFAEKSPRCVTLEQAKDICQQVPFSYVGVFVDSPAAQAADYASQLNLKAVQLHGQEDQVYIDQLRNLLPESCQVWLAKGITDTLPARTENKVDRYLLDCKVGQQSGGTGQRFDWQLLQDIDDKSVIAVAGGLTPDNIQAAANLGVALLDINSGVESAPGIKDHQKLTQAFDALRQY